MKDPAIRKTYGAFVEAQVEFALGDNPYGRSFIIGIGNNPPQEPHHKNAYGQDRDDFPQQGAKPEFELTGAMVGGPNLDGYEDDVSDYVVNEVTIDYNAAIVGSLAALAYIELIENDGAGGTRCSPAGR